RATAAGGISCWQRTPSTSGRTTSSGRSSRFAPGATTISFSPEASTATSATSAPSRAAATAWFAPLPPGTREKLAPVTVSPGRGSRSARTTRSRLIDPTTVRRGAATARAYPDVYPRVRRGHERGRDGRRRGAARRQRGGVPRGERADPAGSARAEPRRRTRSVPLRVRGTVLSPADPSFGRGVRAHSRVPDVLRDRVR